MDKQKRQTILQLLQQLQKQRQQEEKNHTETERILNLILTELDEELLTVKLPTEL